MRALAVPVLAALLASTLAAPALAEDAPTLGVTGVVATFADGELDGDTFIVAGNTIIPVEPDAVAGIDVGATVSAELAIPAQTARELRITADLEADAAADAAAVDAVVDAVDAPFAADSVTEIKVAAAVAPPTHYVDVAVNVNGDGYVQPSNTAIAAAIADASAYWVSNTGGAFPGFTIRHVVRYSSTKSCTASDISWWSEAADRVGVDLDTYLAADSGQHLVLIGECRHDAKAALGSLGTSLDDGGVVLTQANLYRLQMAPQILNGLLAHEFGHNFSLDHANSADTAGCDFSSTPMYTEITSCGTYEYGDEWSVMGFGLPLSRVPLLDVARRDQLGVSAPGSLATQSGNTTASYQLAALGATGTLKGVKVTVSSGTYYVEYRTSWGEPGAYFLDSEPCQSEWEPSPTCTKVDEIIPEGPGIRVLKLQDDGETRVEAVPTHAEHPNFAEFALDTGDWWRSSLGDLNIEVGGASSEEADIVVTTGSMPRLTLSPPTFDSAPALGSTVTVSVDAPEGAFLSYRWYLDGVELGGYQQADYSPTVGDINHVLTARVLAYVPGSTPTQAVVSQKVSPWVAALVAPVRVGKAVSISTQWPDTFALTYQWRLNGAVVANATGATYTPRTSDLGKKLSVTITGTDSFFGAQVLTSPATTISAGVLTAPTPVITGSAAVGHKVTASRGTWTAGTAFKYRWYSNGSAISGATASTYTVPTSMAGKKLTVKVTGTKTGYATKTVTSAAIGVPIVSAAYITGTPRVGHTLAAHHGAWTSGTSFAYQWYANGVAISGATASSYKATSAVVGKRITVRIKGTKAGFTTAYRTSPATAKVTW